MSCAKNLIKKPTKKENAMKIIFLILSRWNQREDYTFSDESVWRILLIENFKYDEEDNVDDDELKLELDILAILSGEEVPSDDDDAQLSDDILKDVI